MPTTNTAFSVTDINGEEFDLISNFIVLVKENPSNSSYADVTYVVDKYSRIKKTITSLTASQVSDEAGNLFECTIDGTTAFLNADLVIDIQDNGDGCDIVYSNYDDVSTTYTLEESRNDIETAINDLLPSGGGITNSAGNNYVTKSDGTNVVQSTIFDNGTFVGVNATSATSVNERFQVKTSGSNWGIVHTDGTRILGTYIDTNRTWIGTKSNHDIFIFTNDGSQQFTFNAGGAMNQTVTLNAIGTADIGSTGAFRNLYLNGTITFEGSTVDAYETTLTVTDPSADRTITLPDATGTVALTDSITANYVIKSDGTKSVQSQIFDDGSFVGIGATSALGFEVFRLDNNGVGFAHTGHTTAYVSTFLNSAASGGIAANTTDFLLTNDAGVTLTLSTSDVTSNGNIIPTVTNSKSLGSDTYAWQNLYLTSSVIFEGSTADAYETTLTVADPTADRTITLPNASGTVSLQTGQTYTPSNVTTSRTFDADTVTLAELADIVGTLLTDLSGKVNN